MRYVLGIDAGGTKTVGLLADEHGAILAEKRGPGANLQTHGELEVEKVFDDIMEALGHEQRISAVGLGIAGVDRPHDEAVIRGILRRLGHRETARVVNDAAIALVAGAPGRVGIVILAGTGSIAYGCDRSGRTARAGGYGFLLADEGSGYWLGHEALRATVRACDGRGPETLLRAIVFEELAIGSVAELVPRVYEKGLPKHKIAGLAPIVQKAADQGDRVARDLLAEAAHELSLAARSVARQLDFASGGAPASASQGVPIVLAGGVFKACPSLIAAVSQQLDIPGAEPALLAREPAEGAVALALDLLGEAPRP